MRRARLAACLAGLIMCQTLSPALAQGEEQDEEQLEEPLPPDDPPPDDAPPDDALADDAAADSAAEASDAAAAEAAGDAAQDPDGEDDPEELVPPDEAADAELAAALEAEAEASGEFVYAGDDPQDPLYADDRFNDPEFDPPADDAIGVETGTDDIPDLYELFDEDGDPSFEELDNDIDDAFEAEGLFHERLPIIRKPQAGALALIRPAGQASQPPAASPAVSGYLARKWLGGTDLSPNTAALHAGAPAPRAGPAVLSLYGGVSLPLSRGASAAYLVRNNGAPFQAQIRFATSPSQWLPPEKLQTLKGVPDWELRHICGGTLIAPEWVLSAAHCFGKTRDGPAKNMKRGLSVLLGAEDISKPQSGASYVVDRILIHGKWDPKIIYRNDIALVHIVQKSSGSRVNAISSITRHTGAEPANLTPVSLMGWGRSVDNGRQLAQAALWRADVKLIQVANCRGKPGMGRIAPPWAPGGFDKVDGTTICAGESKAKACSGDSGGPLFFTNGAPRLVGVVSWTVADSCGKSEIPNVYTRVAAFESWINGAMKTPPDPNSRVQRVP